MKSKFKMKEVNSAFNQLCIALDRKIGDNKGEWNLEYQQDHFRISSKTDYGMVYPLGDSWRNSKEFVLSVDFALRSLFVFEN